MLNDPFVLAQAKAIAARLEKEMPAAAADSKIRHLFRLIFGRFPTPPEIEIGQELLRQVAIPNAWDRYCQLLLCTNEFLYVD